MKKYNLTFWQRIELIPIWIMWITTDSKERKSWHLVKKGMEKHEHNFTIPSPYKGYMFYKCEHEGCNLSDPAEHFVYKREWDK
jgi:hypothetical protein